MGCRTPRPAGHARGDLRSSASRRNGWCGASRAEAGHSAWVKSGVNDAKICQIYPNLPFSSMIFPVFPSHHGKNHGDNGDNGYKWMNPIALTLDIADRQPIY